jgi:predicted secreted protein
MYASSAVSGLAPATAAVTTDTLPVTDAQTEPQRRSTFTGTGISSLNASDCSTSHLFMHPARAAIPIEKSVNEKTFIFIAIISLNCD